MRTATTALRLEPELKLHVETLAAWQAYQETGLHVTGSDLSAWLRTWGTTQEGQAPECHR